MLMTENDMLIIKRNGESKSYDSQRIFNAIQKAFQSENINDITTVSTITNNVDKSIREKQAAEQSTISVEDVQDLVEQALMTQGYHKVLRNYILYRELRHKARLESILEKVKHHELKVKISDQDSVIYDQVLIEQKLRRLSQDLYKVSIRDISDSVTKQIYDNIPQKELDLLLLSACRERIEQHFQYSSLSTRLVLDSLYAAILGKEMYSSGLTQAYQNQFKNYVDQAITLELLNPELATYNFDVLSQAIDPNKDSLFHYIGMQILVDRYFLKDREQEQSIIELPQWFWMRIAMGLAVKEKKEEREIRAIEFYKVLSNMDLVSSTPTLFNAGTRFSQMSSCYLNLATDSLDHIFKLFSDNAKLSKWAGGIGSDWTYVRATGSKIKGTNGTSQGIIPFIKIFNDVALAVNQGGKRKGAMCAYLEIWHRDIDQFLELKKNTGDERRRAHDVNTAAWIPDLFMKRVHENKDWTLFCPSDTPDLHDLYGKAFEKRYEEYEALNMPRAKTMKAADLWRRMLTMLYETGHPWITFKDPCNIRSPQDHVGVVHSSNLCTEITLNTSESETAVCNLASLNLVNMIVDGKLDAEKMDATITTGIRMLDNVIDNNYYPTIEAENANMRHRAIGLGVMGYQDALYKLDIAFESKENLEFSDYSMEMISYYSILASSKLAKERGTYKSYKGSKWDRGIFPLDTLDILESERGYPLQIDRKATLNWLLVKDHVQQYGMRNSNVMAIAPTATISNISGVYPCIEPAFKNMYMKENLSGNFIIMNRYLVQDLEQLGLWTNDILKQLKLHNGSIQNIIGIPTHLKEKYKETFEIDMKWLLKAAAKRMKWIDQSASHNIFIETKSGKLLSELYTLAWNLGLKTTYYLRSLGATQVTKTSVQDESEGLAQPEQILTNPAVSTTSKKATDSANMNPTQTYQQELLLQPTLMAEAECEACQ
jgi:ribonucleoside-diphosphate reductase alpha chain